MYGWWIDWLVGWSIRYVVEKQGFPHQPLHIAQRLVMGRVPIEWELGTWATLAGRYHSSLQRALMTELAPICAAEHTAAGDTKPNDPPSEPHATVEKAIKAIRGGRNQVICGMNVNIGFSRCVSDTVVTETQFQWSNFN